MSEFNVISRYITFQEQKDQPSVYLGRVVIHIPFLHVFL